MTQGVAKSAWSGPTCTFSTSRVLTKITAALDSSMACASLFPYRAIYTEEECSAEGWAGTVEYSE